MPIIKATNLVALKELIKKQGPTSEEEFLSKLSSKAVSFYDSVLATNWISSDDEKEIMLEGARHLFPDDIKRMTQLGRELAKHNMTGIYKIFIKIPTIPFIIKRTAALWNSFFKEGKAEVVDVLENSLTLQVAELPDIEDYETEMTCGYILELLDMTGAENGFVKYDSKDPKVYKWHVKWR